jgi:thymidylate kinase
LVFFAAADYFLVYKKRFRNLDFNVVVMDRYVHDFIIDQAINSSLLPKEMNQIQKNCFLNKFHFPDYTIIIDLPAAEGSLRKSDGTSTSYLKMREPYYKSITGPDTLHLDGLDNVADLHDKITCSVFKKLGLDNI